MLHTRPTPRLHAPGPQRSPRSHKELPLRGGKAKVHVPVLGLLPGWSAAGACTTTTTASPLPTKVPAPAPRTLGAIHTIPHVSAANVGTVTALVVAVVPLAVGCQLVLCLPLHCVRQKV